MWSVSALKQRKCLKPLGKLALVLEGVIMAVVSWWKGRCAQASDKFLSGNCWQRYIQNVIWAKNWSSWSARTQPLPFPAGAVVIAKDPEKLWSGCGLKHHSKIPQSLSVIPCSLGHHNGGESIGHYKTPKNSFCYMADWGNWRILLTAYIGPSSTLCLFCYSFFSELFCSVLPQETEKFFYCNSELKLFLYILLFTFC